MSRGRRRNARAAVLDDCSRPAHGCRLRFSPEVGQPVSALVQLALRTAARALALATLCAPALAGAQARVAVPEACGSEAELRAELARLLGPEGAASALPERLRIARDDDGRHTLVLSVRGEHRTLRDGDCRALFKTAIVIAAATVDPRLREEAETRSNVEDDEATPDESRAGVPASENTPAEEYEAAAEPAAEPSGSPPPLRADVWVGAGAAFSLLPQLSPLLEVSGAVARGALGIALSARYLTPTDERASDAYGVRVEGFGARLAALYEPAPFVRLHAGAALDHLSGRGFGSAVEDVSGSGVALAAALEAAVIPLREGPVRLAVGLSGHYALLRPSFEITGYGRIFRMPPLGGGAVVRLGWQFH